MTIDRTRRALLAATMFGAVGARLARADEPTAAQPKLPTVALTIIGRDGARHDFSVELARTPRQQQVGLMFRKALGPDEGMLFVWPHPIRSEMWMENTLIPLDMVFIGPDGTIDSIAENAVPRSLAVEASDGDVIATLELAGGLTARLGISVGDKVVSKALHAPA